MPVDPGNLLVLGRLGDISLIGLPGCARSLNRNGFDWVLERTLAGREPTSEDIARLGSGGLLKETPDRPQPREGGRVRPTDKAGKVQAVLLAAGRSTRMGKENKLLSPIAGKPMVAGIVAMLKQCPLDGMVIVLGHQAEKLRQALPSRGLNFVENKQFRTGMASSIRSGVAALDDSVDAALIMLADMPQVQPRTIAGLIDALNPEEGRTIALPRYRGKRGNPVLFARQHFEELLALDGDEGAKKLLVSHAAAIIEVAVDDPGVLVDVDTREMLRDLEAD
jgi:molybdenum cofactor cytidylyltransferase